LEETGDSWGIDTMDKKIEFEIVHLNTDPVKDLQP
jgi:hypothetical protein